MFSLECFSHRFYAPRFNAVRNYRVKIFSNNNNRGCDFTILTRRVRWMFKLLLGLGLGVLLVPITLNEHRDSFVFKEAFVLEYIN